MKSQYKSLFFKIAILLFLFCNTEELFAEHSSLNISTLNQNTIENSIKTNSVDNDFIEMQKPRNKETASLPRWVMILFLVSLLVFIGFVILKTDQLKLNLLEKRKNRLEALVHQRTVDLLKEKEKVEYLLVKSEKAKMELQTANEIKTKLLDVAAHDLKNPLQSILGFEYLLKEQEDLSDDSKEMLDAIFRSSKKMLSIISDLLDTSSITSSDLKLRMRIENISAIIREVFYNNKYRALQKSQNIDLNLDDSIYANVDTVWFSKAIDNLLSNAIKYSEYDKNIWVSLLKDKNKILIKVRDEGPGISPDERKNLFSKFSKLSAKPTGGENSTGLGLYIAKDIVEKHNGEIEVETELNKGTTFIIKLPAIENLSDENPEAKINKLKKVLN